MLRTVQAQAVKKVGMGCLPGDGNDTVVDIDDFVRCEFASRRFELCCDGH